jgi:hypothetical protein
VDYDEKKGFWTQVLEGVAEDLAKGRITKAEQAQRELDNSRKRSDWVAACIADKFESMPAQTTGLFPTTAAQLWDWAEVVYDEGKKRGHLP